MGNSSLFPLLECLYMNDPKVLHQNDAKFKQQAPDYYHWKPRNAFYGAKGTGVRSMGNSQLNHSVDNNGRDLDPYQGPIQSLQDLPANAQSSKWDGYGKQQPWGRPQTTYGRSLGLHRSNYIGDVRQRKNSKLDGKHPINYGHNNGIARTEYLMDARHTTVRPKHSTYEKEKAEINDQHIGTIVQNPDINIDEMRGTNYYNNHTLPYPVVNRQLDHTNVRNNPKSWQKRLEEQFVPEPIYENYGIDPSQRRNMEIMTREEYADLQHFPRARRKYFEHTMQPNRYIFTNERSQVRDNYLVNDRNNLGVGGKSSTYAFTKQRPESMDIPRNTLSRRPDDFHETGDNHILYQKRVGDKNPPYADLECFTRTKQAYIQPDYIRDRAQGALRQSYHKKNWTAPREKDYPMPQKHMDGFYKEQAENRQSRMKDKLK